MANAQTNVLVKIGAALNSGFRTAFQSADQQLKQLGQTASDMNAKLATMRGFQQLEAATKQLATEWSQARAQARTLKSELDAMQPALQQQSAALKQANSELTRSGDRYRAAKIALEQMRAELKATAQPTQAQVEALKRAQQAAEQARGAWQSAKDAAKGLAADMKQADAAAREKARALQQAEQAAARAGDQFRRNREAMRGMREEMQRAGTDTKKLAEEQKKLEQQLAKTAEQQRKLAALKQARGENMQQRSDYRGQMFDAMAIGATAMVPIRAFAEAEDSATQLKVAMMGIGGVVSPEFGKVKAMAEELGRTLPGTTAQFQDMARILIQKGLDPKVVLGGAGEATAKLGILTKVSFEEAADGISVFQDSMRVADKDMVAAADQMQRLYNVGMKISDIKEGFKAMGPALSYVKKTGIDAVKELAPLLAITDAAGMDAGSAGNAYNKIIRGSVDKKKVDKANDELKGTGVKLNFVDDKGNFAGISNMVSELMKIKNLSDQQRKSVIEKLFGSDKEVAETLDALMKAGNTGIAAMKQKLDQQASLQERIKAQLGTLKNVADATGGSVNAFLVNIGESLAPLAKGVMRAVGTIADGLTMLTGAFPGLTSAITTTAVVLGGLKVASIVSGFGMTFLRGASLSAQSSMLLLRMNVAAANAQLSGMAAAGIASASAGLASMRARIAALSWGGLIAGARSATMSFIGMGTAAMATAWGGIRALGASMLAIATNPVAAARNGFAAVTAGIRIMGAAMIANPIGLIAAGIAVAGLLIYQNWERISAFFSGFAQGVMSGIGPAMPVFQGISNAVAGIFNWFSQLLSPVQATSAELASATEAGKSFGQIVGQAIGAVLEIIGKVVGAIGSMTQAAVSGFNAVASFLGLGGSTPAAPGATPAKAPGAAPVMPGTAAAKPAGSAPGTPGAATAPANTAGAAAAKAPAAAAQPGAGGKTVNMTSNPTYNVNVTAQGNPDDIAKAVRKEQERMHSRNASADRASMHDTPTY